MGDDGAASDRAPLIVTDAKDEGSSDGIRQNQQAAPNSSFNTSILSSARDEDVGQQYEELLMRIGGFGRYQKYMVFLVLLPMFFAASFVQSSWLFIAATPTDHWCQIPLNNITSDEERALLPLDSAEDKMSEHAACTMYSINYSSAAEEHGDVAGLIGYLNESRELFNETTCQFGWNYDQPASTTTLVSEFGLVCGAGFLTTLAYILSSVAGATGIPLGGYLSDRFGRTRSYFLFMAFYILVGIASCSAPSYVPFVVLVCIQNIAANPIYFIPYMIGIEILVPDARSTYSVLLTIAYTLGGISFTSVAYFIRGWRVLLFCSTAPFALILLYWFILPESPRWLLSVGKHATVEKFLRKVAEVNGRDYDEVCEAMYQRLRDCYTSAQRKSFTHAKKRVSWLDLVKSPNLRRKTMLMTYLSCNVNLCYAGLNYYAPGLGGNPYLSFLLVDVVELPASLMTQAVADRLGRRLTMVVCLTLFSVLCLFTALVPNHGASAFPVLLTLFLAAKMFITSAYTVQELIVYELYPTLLRGVGVSFTNIVGYLFSNLGPVVVGLRSSHAHFPMVIFGAATFGGIFCIMALPETLHNSLPETLAEAENFGKDTNMKDCLRLWPPSKSQTEADRGTLST